MVANRFDGFWSRFFLAWHQLVASLTNNLEYKRYSHLIVKPESWNKEPMYNLKNLEYEGILNLKFIT